MTQPELESFFWSTAKLLKVKTGTRLHFREARRGRAHWDGLITLPKWLIEYPNEHHQKAYAIHELSHILAFKCAGSFRHDNYFKSIEMEWCDKLLGLELIYKGAYPERMLKGGVEVYNKSHLKEWFKGRGK